MGLSSSTARGNNFAFPPPVQTRDELLQRYSHLLAIGPKGISDEGQRCLEAVFNTFCSQSESTKYWSESNLRDFLQSTIPTEITPYLTDAIPILHRTLLRMGSFPYQNNPDPEKLLVLETLRTACILFSREPEDLAGNSDLLIIMFQSMAGLGPRRAQEDGRPRDEDDDDHLKQALWMVRNRARDPNNPRVMISGPENPPPSHFPSSWSKDFDQSIPTGDFRSFLRLMTVLNLYHGGANVSNLSVQQIEEVTSCMLAAFQPSTAGITWNNFSQVIENHMPILLRGVHLLLDPFTSIKPLLQEDSLSADDMRAILQQISTQPSHQRQIPSSTNILSPPILSQLDVILPHYILPQNISISWSEKGDQLNLDELRHHIPIQTPSILLVSGKNEDHDVMFGIFEPAGSEDRMIQPFMVQLAPLHRVFHALSGTAECSILLEHAEKSPTLTIELISKHDNASASHDQPKSQQRIARLAICGNGGHFTLPSDNPINEHFHVNAIELLKSDIVEDCGYS